LILLNKKGEANYFASPSLYFWLWESGVYCHAHFKVTLNMYFVEYYSWILLWKTWTQIHKQDHSITQPNHSNMLFRPKTLSSKTFYHQIR